jgi:hypothetical protein
MNSRPKKVPGALASFTGLKLTEPSRSYHGAGLVQKAIVGNKKVDTDPTLPRWSCECDRRTSDLALKRIRYALSRHAKILESGARE